MSIKKSIIISVEDENYICSQMFDTMLGDGIDINKESNGEFIGDMFGLQIPDVNDDDEKEYVIDFTKKVSDYIINLEN